LESKLCILETNTWLGVGFGDDVLWVVRFLVIKRDWSVVRTFYALLRSVIL
jgi:hypothetical protein